VLFGTGSIGLSIQILYLDSVVRSVPMLEGVLPLLALAYWALVAAAIVILVSAIVRISHSFEQISRALTDIADTLRRRNP
jgi:hypothetical protein